MSRRLAAGRSAVARFAAALSSLTMARTAFADAESGREKARVCVACHGPGGNSTNPVVPTLAGQPQQFIVTQLFMFREGKRKDA